MQAWLSSAACLAAGVALAACASDAANGEEGATDAQMEAAERLTLADLREGRFLLHVDRVWNGSLANVQLPTDPLSEDDYEPIADGADYLIELSDGGRSVIVRGATDVIGLRKQATDARVQYTLDTFAGGRWVAWEEADGISAELTLYGSGVPIAKSERGVLRVE